jgi:hypothetical protein
LRLSHRSGTLAAGRRQPVHPPIFRIERHRLVNETPANEIIEERSAGRVEHGDDATVGSLYRDRAPLRVCMGSTALIDNRAADFVPGKAGSRERRPLFDRRHASGGVSR